MAKVLQIIRHHAEAAENSLRHIRNGGRSTVSGLARSWCNSWPQAKANANCCISVLRLNEIVSSEREKAREREREQTTSK